MVLVLCLKRRIYQGPAGFLTHVKHIDQTVPFPLACKIQQSKTSSCLLPVAAEMYVWCGSSAARHGNAFLEKVPTVGITACGKQIDTSSRTKGGPLPRRDRR